MKYVLLTLCISILACKKPSVPDEITLRGEAFGTTYGIKYFGNGNEAAFVKKAVDSVVAAVNQSMSTYIPDSDISRINRGDTTVVIDDMFLDVFTLSRKLNKATSGYFDPTVGTLRNAYGFGDTEALNEVDSETLDSLMQYVGWSKVGLKKKRTISKKYPEIYFDFNAIAKGYGIDRIGAYLESQGYTNYLVELGGEIKASGIDQGDGNLWRVGVESIDSTIEDRTPVASVVLENVSMAGSGNYRKYRVDEATGKQYVHTINPLTGAAEQIDILSANVIAPTCAEADAWATAFMAMGIEKSKTILTQQAHIEVYLTYDGGSYATAGFEKLVKN